MELLTETIFQLVIVLCIFLVLTIVGEFTYNKLKSKYGKSIDVTELLPEDEVHSLRQVFYLILMALCVVNIFYFFIGYGKEFMYSFPIFDIALSLYFAIKIDKSSIKNKIIWLLLVPYGTLCLLLFPTPLLIYIGFIHILTFIYFAKVCYDKLWLFKINLTIFYYKPLFTTIFNCKLFF